MDTYENACQRGENKLCLIHDKWKITSLDLAKSKNLSLAKSKKLEFCLSARKAYKLQLRVKKLKEIYYGNKLVRKHFYNSH